MITPQTTLDFVRARPFRPVRIDLASGRTVDVRHPEMIKVLRSDFIVFKSLNDDPEVPVEADSVSLMLTESVSPLEAPVA